MQTVKGTRSVNVGDLLKLKRDYPIIYDYMILPILTQQIIEHNKRQVDGEAALLVRDTVPQDQWQAIIKVMHEGIGPFPGYHKNLFCMYEGHKRI